MHEIILELSLNRSSGVLAGVVSSLAKTGIELKSQKLRRATEGRGGWLTITGIGESPEPAALASRLNETQGVDRLMRVIVNGQAVMAEGEPLEDQIQPEDLAGLSAGSETRADSPQSAPGADTFDPTEIEPEIEDTPNLLNPETPTESSTGLTPEPEPGMPPEPAKTADIGPETPATIEAGTGRLESAVGTAPDYQQPTDNEIGSLAEPGAEPEGEVNFASALRDGHEDVSAAQVSDADSDKRSEDESGNVIAMLRRRRRRRR